MQSSLYIHWPFCESKCPYCDFNSHVREKIDYQDWENSYLQELGFYKNNLPSYPNNNIFKTPSCDGVTSENNYFSTESCRCMTASKLNIKQINTKITSIFFGGGTPSLMKASTVEKILNKVSKNFKIAENIEITLEANPSSSEAQKFEDFKSAGVNRLSLGIQSFNPENLKFLGRRHDRNQAIKAIEMAGNVYKNFSFDLIYALPNQNLEEWEKELEFAFSFGSPHLSLYQLTIEKGTDFYGQYKRKEFHLPPTEIQNELYDLTVKKAKQAGLLQYEISNFAKRSFESQHNLNYWRYGNYIGVGAGAHGRISGIATMNIHNPENWLQAVREKGEGIQSTSQLSIEERIEEFVYMGLRVKEGLSLTNFKKLSGKEFTEYFGRKIVKNLEEAGYIKIYKNRIKPTYAGLKLHRGIVGRLFV